MKYRRAYGKGLVCLLFLGRAVVGQELAGQDEATRCPDWAVLNIAHRGGIVPGHAENTLAAYRRSISIGVDVIEIDLRGTRDGEIVILHDETLDRTTDGSGNVTDHTLAELNQLDAGNGESVPSYADVLELVADSGVKLLLDIKISPALDKQKVVRLTERHNAVLDVIAGVRTLGDLQEFRQLNPNIRTLGFIKQAADIDEFVAGGVDIIRLWPDWIAADPDLVDRVHALGKPVWTTAGDAPLEALQKLVCAGVNGVLHDFPELAAEVLINP
jgi:glycerophosphoryl diester phosphodiesterase